MTILVKKGTGDKVISDSKISLIENSGRLTCIQNHNQGTLVLLWKEILVLVRCSFKLNKTLLQFKFLKSKVSLLRDLDSVNLLKIQLEVIWVLSIRGLVTIIYILLIFHSTFVLQYKDAEQRFCNNFVVFVSRVLAEQLFIVL